MRAVIKMKLACITSHPDVRGGEERFVLETATRLIKLGHEIKIFCNSMDPAKAYPEMLQIPYEVFPAARRELFGYFTAYFSIKAIRPLIEKSIEWKPDVILLNMCYTLASHYQRLTDIPIVPFVHYPETFQQSKKSFVRNMYRKFLKIEELETTCFKEAPLVLCNSHYTEQTIHKLEPTARTKVIYPAVDHKKFKPTWEDENYLYYHSRYQEMKNQLLAIKACSKYNLILSGFATKKYAQNFKYYLNIRDEALKYGHKVLINITDQELIQFLQKCSIFLFPSMNEHFGTAPVEAMACGKPVIGHNSGGTIETVGKVGILCGNDVKEWEEAIQYLMENDDARRDMGKKAYEFSKQFNWERVVKQLLESFEYVKAK